MYGYTEDFDIWIIFPENQSVQINGVNPTNWWLELD